MFRDLYSFVGKSHCHHCLFLFLLVCFFVCLYFSQLIVKMLTQIHILGICLCVLLSHNTFPLKAPHCELKPLHVCRWLSYESVGRPREEKQLILWVRYMEDLFLNVLWYEPQYKMHINCLSGI